MMRYQDDYFCVDDSVIRSPTYYTKTQKDSFISTDSKNLSIYVKNTHFSGSEGSKTNPEESKIQ